MRIGLVFYQSSSLDSLNYLAAVIAEQLGPLHEVVRAPARSSRSSAQEQLRNARSFVEGCDILIGIPDPIVLSARARASRRVPWLVLVLGTLSRGGFSIAPVVGLLQASDVLVVSSAADAHLVKLFFRAPRMGFLPFPVDELRYFPSSPEDQRTARARIGVAGDARLLLYAGRVITEKNVHTVLRVFRAVYDLEPDLHLLIVGPNSDEGVAEFGSEPRRYAASLRQAALTMQMDPDRVRLVGRTNSEMLRHLYSTCDVVINLTLNHDENFGFAQVEAMACGTPSLGTYWGGLKDTIRPGLTGEHVSTVLTPLGVKVDWWEAAQKLGRLLSLRRKDDRAYAALRQSAVGEYSRATFAGRLEALLQRTVNQDLDGSPIEPTDFALHTWQYVVPDGDRPLLLEPPLWLSYQNWISQYGGRTTEIVESGRRERRRTFCLAVPVRCEGQRLELDDPIYPFVVSVPAALFPAVARILRLFAEHPILTEEQLKAGVQLALCLRALQWLEAKGVVLSTISDVTPYDPASVTPLATIPVFSYLRLSQDAPDFIVSDRNPGEASSG